MSEISFREPVEVRVLHKRLSSRFDHTGVNRIEIRRGRGGEEWNLHLRRAAGDAWMIGEAEKLESVSVPAKDGTWRDVLPQIRGCMPQWP